jgi:very-short-patch-repair endonuclease
VAIPRVGRVDTVVGERLVLESDGHRYHSSLEQFHEDRRRDLELAAQGYLCLRLDNHQIMHDWPGTEAVIVSLIRRREHLWTPAQRRRHDLS